MTEPDREDRTPTWLWVAFGLGFLLLGAVAFFIYYVTHSSAVG